MNDLARAARLRSAREAAGFDKAAEAARALDVPEPTYQAHENGSRGFTASSGEKYARRFGVEFAWLMTGKPPRQSTGSTMEPSQLPKMTDASSARLIKDVSKVQVIGAVQAGVWSTAAEWPEDEQYETLVRINTKYRGLEPVAFEVRGPSMNRVYPHSTVVICVRYIDLGREPVHGERVVVQRYRGDDVEASVKEYRRDGDGTPRLWPLSTHPEHQAPIRVGDGDDVRITHKVISAQIDEP